MSFGCNNKAIHVNESFKINFERVFRDFLMDPKRVELEFPTTLDRNERAYIHMVSNNYAISSRSTGVEPHRKLCLKKKLDRTSKPVQLNLSDEIAKVLTAAKRANPLQNGSDRDLNGKQIGVVNRRHNQNGKENRSKLINLKFLECNKRIPISSYNDKWIDFRVSLPIWNRRMDIMRNILYNQVSMIIGDTGSGKSTQVPQFILDYSRSMVEPCKIIVCEPKRIAAIGLAEHVAEERNEIVGNTVGYQIFLESRVAPLTNLIYCTNGVFLRWLMANQDMCLSAITHIIIDEVHERDQFTDFLLIILKEVLSNYPKLRLILMSATMNIELLSNYFGGAPVIEIPGRQFFIEEYFLEDVLNLCQYMTPAMSQFLENDSNSSPSSNAASCMTGCSNCETKEDVKVDEILRTEIDNCINMCFDDGGDEYFFEMLQFIAGNDVSVDYCNQSRFLTVLMAAAYHGKLNMIQQLINLGAKTNVLSQDNYTAYDYAIRNGKFECANYLRDYNYKYERYEMNDDNCIGLEDISMAINTITNSNNMVQRFLKAYQKSIDEDVIDFDLIVELTYAIHRSNGNDAILIFLSGYEEIFTLKNRLEHDKRFEVNSYAIFTLHSQMKVDDQKKVFNVLNNKRKIILSTNISETSITIDDVMYVIDCGKVKEKYYDVFSNITSLRTVWISQSSAKQRMGRAGRLKNGICFHLFSKMRYQHLQKFTIPEILRMPLHVICLHAKKFLDDGLSITEFLGKAIEPPPGISIEKAIESLKILGALNDKENLTDLGHHLIDYPIEPHLAKILINSTFLRCVDPILTIVSCLAIKDPFVLPSNPDSKQASKDAKIRLSYDCFSDHVVFLKAFQEWQESVVRDDQKTFCRKHFLNSSTMEMIVATRNMLLSQLRQSGFLNHKPPHDIRYLNGNSDSWPIIKATLATGLYPNIAYFKREKLMFRTVNEKKVTIHISSTFRCSRNKNEGRHNSKILPTDWVLFENLVRTNSRTCQIQCCSAITDLIPAIFCGNTFIINDLPECPNQSEIVIDNWLRFSLVKYEASLLYYVRLKWQTLVSRRLVRLNRFHDDNDDRFVTVLNEILKLREKESNFPQPPGAGQRPKQFKTDSFWTSTQHGMDSCVNFNSISLDSALKLPIPEILCFEPIEIIDQIRESGHIDESYGFHFNNNENMNNLYFNRKMNENRRPSGQFNDAYVFNNDANVNGNGDRSIWVGKDKRCYQNVHNTVTGSLKLTPDNDTFNYLNLLFKNKFGDSNNNEKINNYENNAVELSVGFKNNSNNELIPEQAAYILVEASNVKTIDLSLIRKTWTFSLQTKAKIKYYLSKNVDVYVYFFVYDYPYLCGLAEVIGNIDPNEIVLESYSLGWISRATLPINNIRKILQLQSLNLPEVMSDGYILGNDIGKMLYQMFTDCGPERPNITEPVSVPGHYRAIVAKHQ